MLLLFDIDGTLVKLGGAGRRALNRAFTETFALDDVLHSVRLDGNTDPAIVREAFQIALCREPRSDEVEALYARYLSILEAELASAECTVLPGVLSLVRATADSGRFVTGLATGNIERGARLKLRRAGIDAYFEFGGPWY